MNFCNKKMKFICARGIKSLLHVFTDYGGKSGKSSFLEVSGVIFLYWTVSISMVFINKHLLSGNYSIGDLSIFIAWSQCFTGSLFICALNLVARLKGHQTNFQLLDIELMMNDDMLRLLFCFVASLTMNNLMLEHIEVAFYQVARSFTLIFTILLSYMMLQKSVSIFGIVSCAIVIFGFYLCIDQENTSGTFSVWGIIYGILASLSSAFCGIYFKRVEKVTNNDSLKLAYYNNLNSFLFFLPLVFSTGQLRDVISSNLLYDFRFLICLMISGVFSLSLGWVSALQIKHTSPITHHISINAKSVVLTVIAVLYFGAERSFYWWSGNFFVICGIMLYACTKVQEESELPLPQNV